MIQILIGNDYGLLKQEVNKIINQHQNYEILKFDGILGFNDAFNDSLQENLFNIDKLYLIYNSELFSSLDNFKDSQKKLTKLLESNAHFVFLESNKKLSAAKEVQEFLKKVKVSEVNSLTSKTMNAYIIEYVKKISISISLELVNYLSLKLIPNALIVGQELDKLKNYKNISKEIIDEVICDYDDSNIFKLIDYLFTKQVDKALTLYDQLLESKVEINTIIAALAQQIYQLFLIKKLYLKKINPSMIAKELGLAPFIISNAIQLINNQSLNKIKYILNGLYDLDIKIKKNSVDKKIALRSLITFF